MNKFDFNQYKIDYFDINNLNNLNINNCCKFKDFDNCYKFKDFGNKEKRYFIDNLYSNS